MSDGELKRLARRAATDGGDTDALAALGREYLRVTAGEAASFRMRLRIKGSNQTELETASHCILFSYETPVAFTVKSTGRWFRSACQSDGSKWSRTTVKHINAWVPTEEKPEHVPQSELEGLLDV